MKRLMTQRVNPRLRMIGAAACVVLIAGVAILAATARPVLTPWTLDPSDPAVSLEDVEREVILRHPVPDITPTGLATLLARGGATLFDVRTDEEYEAGHLAGAVRIEPGTSAAEIIRLYRDRLDDGPVIFYCTVGVRSSQMMMATLRELAPHAKAGVYNLRGGIFRWTVDGRTLVRGTEPGKPHPYNDSWGQLLARIAPGQ
jgi:rhodanese-related sulfurtransferase